MRDASGDVSMGSSGVAKIPSDDLLIDPAIHSLFNAMPTDLDAP